MSAQVVDSDPLDQDLIRTAFSITRYAYAGARSSTSFRKSDDRRALEVQRSRATRGSRTFLKNVAILLPRMLELTTFEYHLLKNYLTCKTTLAAILSHSGLPQSTHKDINFTQCPMFDPQFTIQETYALIRDVTPWALRRIGKSAVPRTITFPLTPPTSLDQWLYIEPNMPSQVQVGLRLPFRLDAPLPPAAYISGSLLSRVYPIHHCDPQFSAYTAAVRREHIEFPQYLRAIFREFVQSPYCVFTLPNLGLELQDRDACYRSEGTRNTLAWEADLGLRELTDFLVDETCVHASPTQKNEIKQLFAENESFEALLKSGHYIVDQGLDTHTIGTLVEGHYGMFMEKNLGPNELFVERQWGRNEFVSILHQLDSAAKEFRRVSSAATSEGVNLRCSINLETTVGDERDEEEYNTLEDDTLSFIEVPTLIQDSDTSVSSALSPDSEVASDDDLNSEVVIVRWDENEELEEGEIRDDDPKESR